jgi:predicted cupin superfamily sugar epimerase
MTPPESITATEIRQLLRLEPHPVEGGWFRRTYTAPATVAVERSGGTTERAMGSAIYYLLEPGTFSEMHRLASDELFHFYLGDPVEMLQLWPDGSTRVLVLGPDLKVGQHVQTLVPAGVWQGTQLLSDGKVALLGCSVVPGFDFADYESGSYADLADRWPAEAERIQALTRR